MELKSQEDSELRNLNTVEVNSQIASRPTAPDLANGYIILGPQLPNAWRTGVECVLERRDGETSRRAYLSHECRAEAVGDRIFNDAYYEFCVAETWLGPIAIRGGAYNYGYRSYRAKFPETIHQQCSFTTKIFCSERNIRILSFSEALNYVRSGPDNHIYVRLDYKLKGSEYTCWAPCRYTNFPSEGVNKAPYLQPISGQVLFETEDRFYLAYLATNVDEFGTRACEFICRAPTRYFDIKQKTTFLHKIVFRLLGSTIGRLLWTDEYCFRQPVEGLTTFYVYE